MRPPRAAALLLGSVALNLFLAGALAVFLYRQAQHAPPTTPPLVSIIEQLTPEHQASFKRMLEAEGVRLLPLAHDAKKSRRLAARMMVEPQVDRAQVLALLEHARNDEDQARTDLEQHVVEFAAPLSVRERTVLSVLIRRGVKTNRRTLGGAGAPTSIGKRNAPK